MHCTVHTHSHQWVFRTRWHLLLSCSSNHKSRYVISLSISLSSILFCFIFQFLPILFCSFVEMFACFWGITRKPHVAKALLFLAASTTITIMSYFLCARTFKFYHIKYRITHTHSHAWYPMQTSHEVHSFLLPQWNGGDLARKQPNRQQEKENHRFLPFLHIFAENDLRERFWHTVYVCHTYF